MDAEAETTPEPESPFGSANASFGFQKTYNADNDGLKADLNLLFTGAFADCAIRCRDNEWKVHQAILCPRNAYFNSAFNGAFQESSTKAVEWDDEEPWAVEGLLIFLYTAIYPTGLIRLPMPEDDSETHLKLWQIADKRQADGMKDQATKALVRLLGTLKDRDKLITQLEHLKITSAFIPEEVGKAAAAAVVFDNSLVHRVWGVGSLEYGVIRDLVDRLMAFERRNAEATDMVREIRPIPMGKNRNRVEKLLQDLFTLLRS